MLCVIFISSSVGGIVVSIAAFQAVDPGSIPGHRRCFCLLDQFPVIPVSPARQRWRGSRKWAPRWPCCSCATTPRVWTWPARWSWKYTFLLTVGKEEVQYRFWRNNFAFKIGCACTGKKVQNKKRNQKQFFKPFLKQKMFLQNRDHGQQVTDLRWGRGQTCTRSSDSSWRRAGEVWCPGGAPSRARGTFVGGRSHWRAVPSGRHSSQILFNHHLPY